MTSESLETERDEGPEFSQPVVLRIPSSPEYILLARLVISSMGHIAGFGPSDIYDLKLAVTEAVTNVIRHTSVDHFQVEYRVLPRGVEIMVTDAGDGFVESELKQDSPGAYGGFGLTVIRSLVDEVVLESEEGAGTKLKMIRRVDPSVQALNG